MACSSSCRSVTRPVSLWTAVRCQASGATSRSVRAVCRRVTATRSSSSLQVVFLVAQRLRVAEAIGTEQERPVQRHGALQAVGEELLAVGDVADHFERTPLAGDGP